MLFFWDLDVDGILFGIRRLSNDDWNEACGDCALYETEAGCEGLRSILHGGEWPGQMLGWYFGKKE